VRHLLDTHTLLWYVLDDPQLSATAKQAILDPANDILVSPASFWEIAIKVSIGKYTLAGTHEQFVDECLHRYRFTVLPVEPAHTSSTPTASPASGSSWNRRGVQAANARVSLASGM